ncbi:LysR family transcriptional regulator [Burkholderia vietnamiensis]|uniref:LysR family transcriptional regulator n=1 Tax=Burkholderia vietnamiensis TaxID=60552 RepID=UPI001D13E843|nr:LysR family transcriptional regulator [Burkholderia vietnamiensis]UEC01746.1 LysR family transcriptional regulator [Burkholderia vietnamiensis]
MTFPVEFRLLRVFVELVKQGGFSKAAAALSATQPTITKSVQQLEGQLGVPLLDRGGNRLVLTEYGELIYQRGIKLLAEREDLLAEIESLRGLGSGVLRLSFPPLSAQCFSLLIDAFHREYPHVTLRLKEISESGTILAQLNGAEIDFGIVSGEVPLAFNSVAIHRDPFIALLCAGHREGKGSSVTLSQLRDEPFILFQDQDIQRQLMHECLLSGFSPNVVAASGDVQLIVDFVTQQLGVAVLPESAVRRVSTHGIYCIPLGQPGFVWMLSMVWRQNTYLSESAQAWLSLVKSTNAMRI